MGGWLGTGAGSGSSLLTKSFPACTVYGRVEFGGGGAGRGPSCAPWPSPTGVDVAFSTTLTGSAAVAVAGAIATRWWGRCAGVRAWASCDVAAQVCLAGRRRGGINEDRYPRVGSRAQAF